jgi:hypothetical protein
MPQLFGMNEVGGVQELSQLLTQAGFPPIFIDITGSAVSVWYWIGAASIQIVRDVESSLKELAADIAAEAQIRGVRVTRP